MSEFRGDGLTVLIIDDRELDTFQSQDVVTNLARELSPTQVLVHSVTNLEQAFAFLAENPVHVILLDRDLGKASDGSLIDGLDAIPTILGFQPRARVLVMTSFNEIAAAVEAMKQGATDYIVKPGDADQRAYRDMQIRKALKAAQFELQALRMQVASDTSSGETHYRSQAMRDLDFTLDKMAESNLPVLILGDSGLGKTYVAKRLSNLTKRKLNQKERLFISVNASAIQASLQESELFGSEKGSFTGSVERKLGLFELANGGDLFLDEFGDMPWDLQTKLLKVIEERQFKRVGGTQVLKTSARIIVATNRNLKEMVDRGEFRRDLFARLPLVINMPTLEERKDDIPFICQEILTDICRERKTSASFEDFPATLQKFFLRDSIPFNIRGIRSDLERLLLFSPVGKHGKYDFSGWRATLGNQKVQAVTKSKPGEFDWEAFKKGKIEMLTPSFPGWGAAIELIRAQFLTESVAIHPTNRERAKALGLSESALWVQTKKWQGHKEAGK